MRLTAQMPFASNNHDAIADGEQHEHSTNENRAEESTYPWQKSDATPDSNDYKVNADCEGDRLELRRAPTSTDAACVWYDVSQPQHKTTRKQDERGDILLRIDEDDGHSHSREEQDPNGALQPIPLDSYYALRSPLGC
jgi:hypothetical protein